jgi:enoyl-CoA hydratase/carnithine racemase
MRTGRCDAWCTANFARLGFHHGFGVSAPLSLTSIRATMRRALVADVAAALDTEAQAQAALLGTADFREGVAAARARRAPVFGGA